MGIFRYVDRWQQTLAPMWSADRERRDGSSFAALIDRLEARDRDLEEWLDIHASRGIAWTDWSPVVTQGAAVDYAPVYAQVQLGRTITAQCRLTITGTGTAGATLGLSVPTNHPHGIAGPPIGQVVLSDVSANEIFVGFTAPLTSSSVFFLDLSVTAAQRATGAGTMGSGGSTFNDALEPGDILSVSLTYEAAT